MYKNKQDRIYLLLMSAIFAIPNNSANLSYLQITLDNLDIFRYPQPYYYWAQKLSFTDISWGPEIEHFLQFLGKDSLLKHFSYIWAQKLYSEDGLWLLLKRQKA